MKENIPTYLDSLVLDDGRYVVEKTGFGGGKKEEKKEQDQKREMERRKKGERW